MPSNLGLVACWICTSWNPAILVLLGQIHHPQLTGYSRSTGSRLLSQIYFWTRGDWNVSNPLTKRKGNRLEKIRIAMWLGFNSCPRYPQTNKNVQQIMDKNQEDYAAKFYPAQLILAEWPSTVLATYQLQVPCQSASPNCRAPIHGSLVPVGKQPAWLCQWLMLLADNNHMTILQLHTRSYKNPSLPIHPVNLSGQQMRDHPEDSTANAYSFWCLYLPLWEYKK